MIREVGTPKTPTSQTAIQAPRRNPGAVAIGAGRVSDSASDRKDWLPKGTVSFSAISCFNQCPRKFFHRYIAKTPKDPDAQWDPLRLAVGKCFHKILEDSNHMPCFGLDWLNKEGSKYRKEFQIGAFDLAKVVAMAIRYRDFHVASKWRVVSNEVMIHRDGIGGFVDSIMIDSVTKLYWIVDNKTAAGRRKGLTESMRRNLQLSVYAALRREIEKQVSAIQGYAFGGVAYRCSLKPEIKFNPKKDSEFWETVKRCTTETYEIQAPASILDLDTVMGEVLETAAMLNKAKTLGRPLRRNLESCLAYGDTCEFWSQCYGATATNCRNETRMWSLGSAPETNEHDDLI